MPKLSKILSENESFHQAAVSSHQVFRKKANTSRNGQYIASIYSIPYVGNTPGTRDLLHMELTQMVFFPFTLLLLIKKRNLINTDNCLLPAFPAAQGTGSRASEQV